MKQARKEQKESKGPVRAIIDQCPHRDVGGYHLAGKTLYPAEWESFLERGLIHLLLVCDDVVTIETQPEKLQYNFDDKEREYTPDIASTTRHGDRIYVEVKSIRYLLSEEQIDKYVAIAASLQEQGYRLDFITGDQMNKRWLETAALLKRYLRIEVDPAIQLAIEQALSTSPLTISRLLEASQACVSLTDVYALIGKGYLCIDWNVPLDRKAQISLPGRPFERMAYAKIRDAGRFADLLAEMALGRRPQDQRRLAYAQTWRRATLPPSPLGFVGGLSPQELGHLGRKATQQYCADGCEATAVDGAQSGAESACSWGG